MTTWVSEHPIKAKKDIELFADYAPELLCDVDVVNNQGAKFSERGIVRGHICGFDTFGQPGCWQDACCMFGVENLIMATFDDSKWVHEFLSIIQKRKLNYVKSLEGAKYDILELGGGDGGTTVISPAMFNEYVAPYDRKLIEQAHKVGQKIVYHICGGMMPILEDIVAMGPNAMETFTPPEMGGDADLQEAKKRVGNKVCMIGGFNQVHYLNNCAPQKTRDYVRRCFQEAGDGGGYILSPSDHFFDADIELLRAFSDEALKCIY
jgi:uroporphyrinogen-III decarboxylase